MSHLSFYILLWLMLMAAPLQSQKKWDGGGGDDLWDNPLNWTGNTLPSAVEDIILDNSVILSDYIVVLPVISVTVRSVLINPAAGRNIELILPVENKQVPGLIITGPGYGLTINKGGIFRNSSGASSGTPVSIADSIRINNDGKYIHHTPRAHAANVERLSMVPGTEKGIMEFDIPDPSTTISLSGRTYGRLILKSAAAGGALNYTAAGTSKVTIRDNLEIEDGVNFNLNFSDTITVRGNLVQGNAVLNLGNTARSVVLAVKGNIIQSSSGNIIESGTGIQQILLNGMEEQQVNMQGTISGDISVVKDGGANARLLSSLSLPYILELKNGNIISSAAAYIELGSACAVRADTLNADSFIDGPMKKNGLNNESFLFPVGKGERMRWISLVNASGDFTVEYFHSDPNEISTVKANGIDHISSIEYWSITGNIGATASAKLSFSDPHSGGVTNLADLRVARLQSGTWQNAGNINSNGTPGSNGWVSSSAAGGFSAGNNLFALASAIGQENPLPISRIELRIKKSHDKLIFKWEVNADHAIRQFQLQSADDNIHFCSFDVITPEPGKTAYQYELPRIASIKKYYRIRAINADSSNLLSKTISIISESNKSYAIMNAQLILNNLNVRISLAESKKVDFMIYNSTGQALKRFRKELRKGISVVNIEVNDLKPGIYLLSVLSDYKEFMTFRFAKRPSS